MAHHQEGNRWYVDTDFINNVQYVVPGAELIHMGFGEFYLQTPRGRIDFDRMRGKDFPGQSGRSHWMTDDKNGKLVAEAVRLMERRGKSERMASLRSSVIRLAYEDKALRPHLLRVLKAARGKYVLVKDLPDSVQKVLKQVRYGRRDIELRPATSYQMAGASGEGKKAFIAAVNLESGQYKIEWGSWGGANIFNPDNPVDLDTRPRPLRKNMAVVQGTTGGGKPTWAHVDVHPSNLQQLIGGDEEDLTEDEVKAVSMIVGYKPFYRKEQFPREGLGEYGPDNPIILSLQKKGMVKINRAGAIQATTAGRNKAQRVY
jgi:hypothetical protein